MEYPKEEPSGISRREFLKILALPPLAACMKPERAMADILDGPPGLYEKGWFYNLEEMEQIYEREYREERPLKVFIEKKEGKCIATYGKEEFEIPDRFIKLILTHLKRMLESGAARFLFRLDAFHGHFFVSEEIYKEKYLKTSGAEMAFLLVREEKLGVLYHNSEHLKLDEKDVRTVDLYSKRNVIGDTQGSLRFLPPPPKGQRTAASTPEGTHDLAPYLCFAANQNGEFSISVNGREIRLDIGLTRDLEYY